MCHACMGTVLHTLCMHYPNMFNKEDMHTMYIYHYLCLQWHGRITPAAYAATLREARIRTSMGYALI